VPRPARLLRSTSLVVLFPLAALGLACPAEAPPPEAPSAAPASAPASTPARAERAVGTSTSAAIDVEDPASCAACHAAIAAEWQESLHARAQVGADPIFTGVRRLRMAREGEAIGAACASCHSPRHPERGVTCATCHTTAHVKPDAMGAAALVPAAPGVLLGPSALAGQSLVSHGLGDAPPHMKDGRSLCLACHGEMKSPRGVSVCATGVEHAAVEGEQSCVACHMARAAGAPSLTERRGDHASHRFAGASRAFFYDDPSMLRSSVTLEGERRGRSLVLKLRNTSGHAFPTGFPGRMAALSIRGLDAKSAPVWTHTELLNKVYLDAAGAPTLAPWAVQLAKDTRLTPGELRRLEYALPAGVTKVEVRLLFRLLPPPLAEKIGLTDPPWTEAREVARLEL
jgi:hypothetical protein